MPGHYSHVRLVAEDGQVRAIPSDGEKHTPTPVEECRTLASIGVADPALAHGACLRITELLR